MRYKFRAWLKDENKMVVPYAINFESKVIFYKEPYVDDENMEQIKTASFDEIELMESIYMFNTNGTEIFEGDIVKFMHQNMAIEFINGFYYIVYEDKAFSIRNVYDCPVVGNIYENKEMVEWIKNF